MIQVSKLSKTYGDVHAVRDVSFSVNSGEVFCLLGPNGAGKTTTTEILEGYHVASGGSVSVLGMDPSQGQRQLRERIGIVLQSCGIQADLTVGELIEMYGRYYARRRSADELIELVELDAKRDTRAAKLSGGQRRRLDFALALVGDPDLLFLDEPTTGFDPAARRQAWSTIRSLCQLGKTVFLTTHFMDEAQFLANRVAVLHEGEIIAEGSPDQLGGRELRPTEIRFHAPGGLSISELPEIPALDTIAVEDDQIVISSHEGVLATQRLTTWAVERRVELAAFRVSQPSLEDIYLALTDTDNHS